MELLQKALFNLPRGNDNGSGRRKLTYTFLLVFVNNLESISKRGIFCSFPIRINHSNFKFIYCSTLWHVATLHTYKLEFMNLQFNI